MSGLTSTEAVLTPFEYRQLLNIPKMIWQE